MDRLGRQGRFAVLFFVLGLCLTAGVFGFDLEIGVKVGAALPWYSGPGYQDWLVDPFGYGFPSEHSVFKLGFSGGAFLTIGLFDFLAIQPEVFFSQLGAKSRDGYITWNDKANVIDIQALLKARFPTRRRAIFNLFAGPDLQFKAGTVDWELTDLFGGMIYGFWQDANLRDPVLGLVFGLGMEFPLGSFFFTLDARYGMGLWSRFTDSSGIAPWYQNSVQLMVGAGLVLAGKQRTISRMR